jgi:protein SCO1/2
MIRWLKTLLLSTGLAAVIGCGPAVEHAHDAAHGKDSGVRATDFPTNVTAYEVKGVLKEIRANGWKALIDHEDIPGYMEAMTMLLDVKDTNDLSAVRPGDSIQFRMLVTETDGWIDRVRRIGTNSAPASTNAPAAKASDLKFAEVKQVEVGDMLPDCILTNQAGRQIRLSDFRGKALAFTFIFTRCPFPVYCPRMNNNLGGAQKQLSELKGNTNWHLLSISFDPEFDTPARLATYGKNYRHDPEYWSFATGKLDDVRDLGEGFGLMFYKKSGTIEHNVRTVVVNPAGRVHHIFPGNEWTSDELVAEMKRAMATGR